MRRLLAALAVAVLLPGARPAWAQAPSCSPTGQSIFLRDTLQELYLWYRDLPEADPASYDSPEQYLAAVRRRPLDTSFSHVTSRVANDAFFSDSQFVGLGLSSAVVAGELRVLQVFPGSPAEDAGVERGARIVAVDGRDVAATIASGGGDDVFGPAQAGLELSLVFSTRGGEVRTARVTKRVVTIPTVSLTRVFDVGGRKVGYLFFRNFVRPSVAALDDAFAALQQAGATDLVLDLRYNGGGLVDVASHLASLVGGAPLRDQVFARSHHNDRNRRLDETIRFTNPERALRLDRLIVITTAASASASELLINGLRPFIPVTIVGGRTYGKPVGQYALPFCDKVFAPVSFAMTNADGRGGYFEGLAPDCAVADDLERELGDPTEASLAESLRVAASGACSRIVPNALARDATPPGGRAAGWAALINVR